MEPAEVMARYRRGEISRRDVLRLLSVVGLSSAALPLLGREASAAEELSMVIWEGYADPSFAATFEGANDATISATPMTSSDDAFARL